MDINSFLLLWVSYGLIIISMICEFPTGAGWTIYPPLSTSLMSLSPVNIDIIISRISEVHKITFFPFFISKDLFSFLF